MIMTASQTIRLETELLILGTGAAGCGAKSTGALYLSLRNPEDKQEVATAQVASILEAPSAAATTTSSPCSIRTSRRTPSTIW